VCSSYDNNGFFYAGISVTLVSGSELSSTLLVGGAGFVANRQIFAFAAKVIQAPFTIASTTVTPTALITSTMVTTIALITTASTSPNQGSSQSGREGSPDGGSSPATTIELGTNIPTIPSLSPTPTPSAVVQPGHAAPGISSPATSNATFSTTSSSSSVATTSASESLSQPAPLSTGVIVAIAVLVALLLTVVLTFVQWCTYYRTKVRIEKRIRQEIDREYNKPTAPLNPPSLTIHNSESSSLGGSA
jgi:hypothetical protein